MSRPDRVTPVPEPARALRSVALLVALACALPVALGGCASGAPVDVGAQRQATIERWNRCAERHAAAVPVGGGVRHIDTGCEGHRRDVINAFPPHMEAQLRRLLDESAARHAVRQLGDGARARGTARRGDAARVIERVTDALSR